MAIAALLIAALLIERKDRRHERLVDRLLGEIVAVREDALIERTSLLNRTAAPQLLQQITPTGQIARAISRLPEEDERTHEEDDGPGLRLVGTIEDGAY